MGPPGHLRRQRPRLPAHAAPRIFTHGKSFSHSYHTFSKNQFRMTSCDTGARYGDRHTQAPGNFALNVPISFYFHRDTRKRTKSAAAANLPKKRIRDRRFPFSGTVNILKGYGTGNLTRIKWQQDNLHAFPTALPPAISRRAWHKGLPVRILAGDCTFAWLPFPSFRRKNPHGQRHWLRAVRGDRMQRRRKGGGWEIRVPRLLRTSPKGSLD